MASRDLREIRVSGRDPSFWHFIARANQSNFGKQQAGPRRSEILKNARTVAGALSLGVKYEDSI
jgi:hypothetical protein